MQLPNVCIYEYDLAAFVCIYAACMHVYMCIHVNVCVCVCASRKPDINIRYLSQ